MLDALLRYFGLLLLAAGGAVALFGAFGVTGVIVWVLFGVAALVFHYRVIVLRGEDRRSRCTSHLAIEGTDSDR